MVFRMITPRSVLVENRAVLIQFYLVNFRLVSFFVAISLLVTHVGAIFNNPLIKSNAS